MWKRLTSSGSGHNHGERVHDGREQRPGQDDPVADESNPTQPEGTVGDVVAAADQEADNGDGVGDVQQHDARGHHAVECGGGTEVQQAQQADDEAADTVRDERHVQGFGDL